jgi:hypothetical protein
MKENEAEKNKTPIDPEGIDRWLHQRLGPNQEQVNRVVLRALAGERSGRRPRRFSWRTTAAATAGFCIIAVILALIDGQFLRHQPQIHAPAKNGSADIVATITNESGTVELRLHEKPDAALSPGGKKAPTAEPSIQIFNEDGLVAAEVIDGGVTYLVIGGDK